MCVHIYILKQNIIYLKEPVVVYEYSILREYLRMTF